MSQIDAPSAQLQALWHADFPLSKAMDMRVASYADHVLTTHSSLTPNTNVHGTAFAGSLYAIEALTAWGLIYLELAAAQLDASIIHAEGQIQFAKPVREDIVARSSFKDHQHVMADLQNTGKVKLTLTTQVIAANEIASEFSGVYLVKLNT